MGAKFYPSKWGFFVNGSNCLGVNFSIFFVNFMNLNIHALVSHRISPLSYYIFRLAVKISLV